MDDIALEMKLKNNPLTYRDKLTIPVNINFGLELELDKVNYIEVYKIVRKQIGWEVKNDKSLTKGENAEINSSVLQNTKNMDINKKSWRIVKKV